MMQASNQKFDLTTFLRRAAYYWVTEDFPTIELERISAHLRCTCLLPGAGPPPSPQELPANRPADHVPKTLPGTGFPAIFLREFLRWAHTIRGGRRLDPKSYTCTFSDVKITAPVHGLLRRLDFTADVQPRKPEC